MPPVKLSLMDADFDADDHVASLNVQIRDLLDPAKKEAYLQPRGTPSTAGRGISTSRGSRR